MKWLRHRKARLDRDSGMVFAWRGMHSRLGSTLTAALVVALCAAAVASMIKVRVLSPPARSERRGSVMVALDDQAVRWLNQKGADLTPFPGPLDVSKLDVTTEALDAHPALSGEAPGNYVPQVRPMPEESGGGRLPVGEAGRRTLPALPPLPPPVEPGPPVLRSLRPFFESDSALLADRVLMPLPEFDAGGEPAEGMQRFMLAVSAEGRVEAVMPLERAEDKPAAAVERWLEKLRFEPSEEGGGWFVVTVRLLSSDG
jgi:hypothetical protein